MFVCTLFWMALQRHRMKRPGAARTEKAFKTSRANANSIVGRHFRPNHTERRAIAGPRALNGLCDDEGVPLICPTCQVLTQGVLTGDRLLLCMGLFSIFLVGSHRDALRDIPPEAAHASEAFAVPKWRARGDSNSWPQIRPFRVKAFASS